MKNVKYFLFLLFFLFLCIFPFISRAITKNSSSPKQARVTLSGEGNVTISVNFLRKSWMERCEDERKKNGLASYSYDKDLERTAQVRAETMVKRYKKHPDPKSVHKRSFSDKYFDSKKIAEWFAKHGVNLKPGMFSENIGYGHLQCPKTGDCTMKAREAIYTTFTFFMSEKSRNGPHYRSIVSPVYTHVGVGFAQDKANSRYRIVIHYARREREKGNE